MRTSSSEGINWISHVARCNLYLASVFLWQHMKNDRKMGEIIRKIGHWERKMGKVLGNKRKE